MTKWYLYLAVSFFNFACASTCHFEGVAMTIPYHIEIAESFSLQEKEQIKELIKTHFEEVNRIYNHWNPNSELSIFNQMDRCEALLISKDLRYLIELSKKIHALSNGRFDPTRYDMIASLKKGEIIDRDSPSLFSQLILQSNVALKQDSNIKLDLDAISKGYAIDQLATKFMEAHFHNFLIEWGGEIKVEGAPSSSRNWQVALRHPHSSYLEDALEIISLKSGEALATSGDYLQRLEKEHTTYSHFVDGQTGLPRPLKKKAATSVTIKAKECALADALATTSMLFDTKEEIDHWMKCVKNEFEDIEMWIVYNSQE